MEKSESIKNLAIALIKFQGLVNTIKKDSNNPFFKSKYAALPDILSAIHDPLIECGLAISQFPTGQNGLTTMLIHESGEFMLDTYSMAPAKNDPQGIGSCITYQRRYALGAVLSLNIDEDDDGNKASATGTTTPQATELPWLNPKDTDKWQKAIKYLIKGGTTGGLKKNCRISKENEVLLTDQAQAQALLDSSQHKEFYPDTNG